MERMTKRDIEGFPILAKNIDYKMLLDRLAAYEDAEEQGLLVRLDECLALAMLAGARAIEQNPRKYYGTTFVHDVFGDKPKEISYHDAAKMLREKAEAAIKEG